MNATQAVKASADDKTESHIEDLLRLAIGLETFSLFCCLLVPLAYLAAWKYSPDLCKRVTFQLTVCLSMVEALYCCAQIFSNVYTRPGMFDVIDFQVYCVDLERLCIHFLRCFLLHLQRVLQ
jgi:hypothetical protein